MRAWIIEAKRKAQPGKDYQKQEQLQADAYRLATKSLAETGHTLITAGDFSRGIRALIDLAVIVGDHGQPELKKSHLIKAMLACEKIADLETRGRLKAEIRALFAVLQGARR